VKDLKDVKIVNSIFILACLIVALGGARLIAQNKRTMTPEELSRLTLGTPEQQRKAFPAHKIIGDIYYVGTEIQAAFLITTRAGHILINTNFEETVPLLREAVEKLGFRFADIKIVLGSHAHSDHMEGDALVKTLTSASVMAMEQDVPALERMRPGGKPHPIDRVLHDGDEVSLGGTTLAAHLTAGHTAGDTTWTLKADEGGRSYSVVILGGMGVTQGQMLANAAGLTPLAQDYIRSFKFLRSIPCDVPLGSHASMFNLAEKYARLGKEPKGVNPYIDREGYFEELDARERVFNLRLEEQKKAAGKSL
jgi:metallo-beta-lactamase class B